MHSIERPTKVHADDYRIYIVIHYITYLGIAIHTLLIPFFFWLELNSLGQFNIVSALTWIIARKINDKGQHNLAIIIIIIEICLHALLTVTILGWQSGFQFFLIAAVPFIWFIRQMKTQTLIVITTFMCLLFIGLYFITYKQSTALISETFLQSMYISNIMLTFIALIMNAYFFRQASDVSEKAVKKLALTDQLTGLYNRRGLNILLQSQHSRLLRTQGTLSLVMADIDFFKRLNDTYGHHCGDQILQEIAHLLRSRLRKYDAISRWGGEEFLFMLPDTSLASASQTAEVLRKLIDEHQFYCDEKTQLHVTMTFGVAEHTKDHIIEESINQADEMLYKGKESGRNSVCSQ